MSGWLAVFRADGADTPAEPEMPETPRNPFSGGNGAFGQGMDGSAPVCAVADADGVARLLAAAQRAVLSPDALGDEAEVMLRGEPA
jgi:hypothetical protein